MPADQTLLILCVALTVVGLIGTAVAWRRGRRGRVVQGLALTLAPVALYLTGLLQVVFDFVLGVVRWATRIVFSPTVWAGLSLLAVCVVLFVVGGFVARRSPSAKEVRARKAAAAEGGAPRQVGAGSAAGRTAAPAGGPAGRQAGRQAAKGKQQAADVDPEMAEIEALLKSRGIE